MCIRKAALEGEICAWFVFSVTVVSSITELWGKIVKFTLIIVALKGDCFARTSTAARLASCHIIEGGGSGSCQ